MASWVNATPLTEAQEAQKEKYATLDGCSYESTCQSAAGFRRLSDDELLKAGISTDKLIDGVTGLHIDVFIKNTSVYDVGGEVVVAVRGSELTDVGDLKTNIVQAFGGVGGQYEIAADKDTLRALVSFAKSNDASLNVTGHSLGGGVATALASTGYFDQAIVFNAAALHPNTIAAIQGKAEVADQRTISYASRGDLLTNIQDLFLNALLGTKSYGQRVTTDGAGLHGISGFTSAPAVAH